MHVGEAAVDAAGAEGEAGVVDAEEVEDGGANVVDLGGVFAVERAVAPFVAGAVADAPRDCRRRRASW